MVGRDASETPKVGEACGQADDARQRHIGSRAGNRKRGFLGIGRRALAATRARQRVSQASAALESLVTRSDVPCFVLGFEGLGQIWVGGFLGLETAKQQNRAIEAVWTASPPAGGAVMQTTRWTPWPRPRCWFEREV